LSKVIQNIEQIEIHQLLCLSNFVLEQIFNSHQLQIENENYLFNLVIELIKKDSNRKVLLKSIFYPGVSSSLLISYFRDFPIEEIDYNLFNSLKE
jgi:radical SAM superfamily enzyme